MTRRSRRTRRALGRANDTQYRCFGRQDGTYYSSWPEGLTEEQWTHLKEISPGIKVNRRWRRRMAKLTGLPNGGAINTLTDEDRNAARDWDLAQLDYARANS